MANAFIRRLAVSRFLVHSSFRTSQTGQTGQTYPISLTSPTHLASFLNSSKFKSIWLNSYSLLLTPYYLLLTTYSLLLTPYSSLLTTLLLTTKQKIRSTPQPQGYEVEQGNA